MGITITRKRISPTQAKALLATNSNNRPLSQSHVKTFCNAYRRGEWEENGETIKTNGDGKLIDGQHRLSMQVAMGVSMAWYFAEGLSNTAFDTIDEGKRRTLADALYRRGELYYSELATAIRWLVILTTGRSGCAIPKSYGISILSKRPGIRKSVKAMCDVGECDLKRTGIISPGTAAALHYLMRKKDALKADKFWHQIGTGEKLTRKSAAWKFRDIMLQNSKSLERMPRNVVVALAVKAWNAYRDGKNFSRKLTESDMECKIR